MYKQVSLELTPEQQRKVVAGKPIQLSAGAIASNKHTIFVHPENYKKIMNAKKKGTGTRLHICKGAIQHDLEKMEGGSLWSWIKDKAWPWLKKNVLPAVADVAVPAAATFLGAPQLATTARSGLKELTGIGVNGKTTKGSEEAKAKMARLRAMRKGKTTGGSFKIN